MTIIHMIINNLLERYPLSSRFSFRLTTFHSFEKYCSYLERDHKAWTFYRSSGFHIEFRNKRFEKYGSFARILLDHSSFDSFFLHRFDLVANFDRVSKWLLRTHLICFRLTYPPINPTVGLTVQHEEIDVSDMRNIGKFILRVRVC